MKVKVPTWKHLVFFLFFSLRAFAESQVVHGDHSQLPPVDYNKKFEMKGFGGGDHEFKAKAIEMKAADLPTYSGNLKPVPLTEWQSSKTDIYSKSIEIKDFEIKKALEKWSHQADLKTAKSSVHAKDSPLNEKVAKENGKAAKESSLVFEIKNLPPANNLGGEELKDLVNRGKGTSTVEVGTVKVGRGVSEVILGNGSKEVPGMKPPQK